MANNVESNYREKVVPAFTEAFDASRVFSKCVNTQLLDGVFDAESGDSVAFKRDNDAVVIETTDGDVSASNPSPIIVGNAFGRVQNYLTVFVEYQQIDQALKLNQLDRLLKPIAKRMSTTLDLRFASFMAKNTGLMAGAHGNAVDAWADIAEAGAVMTGTGVPDDGQRFYAVNPYSQKSLSEIQLSLGSGGSSGGLIKTAYEKATIANDVAGLRVMTATTQPNYATGSGADRVGALSANPDVTYVTAKDTMTQSLAVSGFNANLVIKAGEQIKITGRNRLNLATREKVLDEAGAPVVWTATVSADVTLSGTGTGTIVATGPAIYEATGAFNTVDSAPISGDVVTLLGAASTTYQPNLFWHKNAFSIGTVALPKLTAQENTGTTEDGIRIKVTRGSDFLKNKNMVRFDILPAFLAANPFLAGQGFGNP